MVNLQILAQIFEHENAVMAYTSTVYAGYSAEIQQKSLEQMAHTRQVLMAMIEELEEKGK